MPTFFVKMKYEGYRTYEVEADNPDHAETIANEVAHSSHFTNGWLEVELVASAEPQDLS
jgi:hypothetical protein